MYCNKFFRTESQAKAFKKQHGGALYRNVKYSKTKKDYFTEAHMTGRTKDFCDKHRYVVAWKER